LKLLKGISGCESRKTQLFQVLFEGPDFLVGEEVEPQEIFRIIDGEVDIPPKIVGSLKEGAKMDFFVYIDDAVPLKEGTFDFGEIFRCDLSIRNNPIDASCESGSHTQIQLLAHLGKSYRLFDRG